jgi:D-3-phosphoglycerate dehydrogenase
MTQSVLVAEKIADAGIELLREQFDVTALPGWSADELQANIGEFDGLVVRSATKVTADVVDAATNLKVIGRAGVGVDNVDLDAASRRGIVVVNAPTSTVASVAEHALALMFALARNVHRGDATMRAGAWERSKLGGVELAGRTLAVLGMGRIGQQLAERARALGMQVVGYDPYLTPDRFARIGVEHAETLEQALSLGDVVSLHMPLTDATRNLVGVEQLAQMKPGARLINTARGGLVDLDALYAALESGQLAGAGLDVYPTEPPPPHPLFERDDVVLTPHLAASTAEAQERAGIATAEQVAAALSGGVVTTAVNIPAMSAQDVELLQPFVPLTTGLSRLAAAIAGDPVSSVSLTIRGEIAAANVRMLADSALVAVLAGLTTEPVTFVNARRVAEDRDIEVIESADPNAFDYRDLVEVRIAGERRVEVAGTTIGGRAWVTSLLGYDLDIELAEHMAVLHYADIPGMIGRVGTAFGDAGVNIVNMAVSRGGDSALMALSFEAPPPAAVLDALAESSDFAWAIVAHT